MPPSRLDRALIAAARAHRRRAAEALAPLGLHPGQDLLLSILRKRDRATQTQLARILGVEPPTVAKMVGRLEAAGFAERATDPADARVRVVTLTARGRAAAVELERAWAELGERTASGLSEEEQEQLARLLLRVAASLGADAEGDDGAGARPGALGGASD